MVWLAIRSDFSGDRSRYLLRDRDSIYDDDFRHWLENTGIEEVLITPRSPWQNPYAERVIASHCHGSLACNSPLEREIEPPSAGRVTAIPLVGGLHHRYTRAA